MEEVFVVSDNGYLSLFRNEDDARKKWLEIVQSIRNGNYFVPESKKTTKIWHSCDEDNQHYVLFTIHENGFTNETSGQVFYGKYEVR